ncbi:PREDICTED: acyl-CoA desaturase-like [Priapulus caudatus]|uniref:Acyl-CoA desaturase-like n=1 Tax=Priapulus caudatus TaxID=37621 RepID=A0ABM1E6F6_PRICU|nr:PREDICTED: acyl-CoA desaturase-like [Priapulus caudatus]
MAPRNDATAVSDELNLLPDDHMAPLAEDKVVPTRLVWRNIILMTYLHVSCLYGIYLCFYCHWQTLVFAYVMYVGGGIGITAGAHRLWSHRAYKAKWPLRVFLAFWNTVAFQVNNRAFVNVRVEVLARMSRKNMKDSTISILKGLPQHTQTIYSRANSITGYSATICSIVNRYYLPLMVLCCFVLPTAVPTLWGESVWNAYIVCGLLRYGVTLNATWLVNSAAHMWGNKPYDKKISPTESFMTVMLAAGEGFHNYHHTFPHDYATSEFGKMKISPTESFMTVMLAAGEGFHNYHHTFPHDYATSEFGKMFNVTTTFLDLMARLGLAYNLKTVPRELVQRRRDRTGDGTMRTFGLLK